MNGQNTKMIDLCFWVAIISIVFIWVIAFGTIVYSAIWTSSESLIDIFLLTFGVGLTVICGVLWVGHVTKVRSLTSGVAKSIWLTLIVSVLATSASIYKEKLFPQRPTTPLQIEDIVLLDENHLTYDSDSKSHVYDSVVKRKSMYFYTEPILIPFLAEISNFQTGRQGNVDIQTEILIIDVTTGLAELAPMPSIIDPQYWSKGTLDQDQIHSLVGKLEEKTIVIGLLSELSEQVLSNGPKIFRFIVKDEIGNTLARKELKFLIRR